MLNFAFWKPSAVVLLCHEPQHVSSASLTHFSHSSLAAIHFHPNSSPLCHEVNSLLSKQIVSNLEITLYFLNSFFGVHFLHLLYLQTSTSCNHTSLDSLNTESDSASTQVRSVKKFIGYNTQIIATRWSINMLTTSFKRHKESLLAKQPVLRRDMCSPEHSFCFA